MHKCLYCSKEADCRPYGPMGAMVCYQCAMAPEHIHETEENFRKQLFACGPVASIGTEAGPVPVGRLPS